MRVEVETESWPYRTPFRISRGVEAALEVLLVTLWDESGHRGGGGGGGGGAGGARGPGRTRGGLLCRRDRRPHAKAGGSARAGFAGGRDTRAAAAAAAARRG